MKRVMSEEHRRKISEAAKGRKRPDLAERNKKNPPMLGKKHSDETKAKMSESNMGKNLGKSHPHTEETKEKLSEMRRGELNPNWAGGKEQAVARRKDKILESNEDRVFDPTVTKDCWKCKENKLITEFYKNSTKFDGLSSECKTCMDSLDRDEYEYGYNLKRLYNIDLNRYNEMLEEQEHKCAGCGKHKSEFKKRLGVDHCHKTGKVRGLLCSKCNTELGIFEKTLEWSEKYLSK